MEVHLEFRKTAYGLAAEIHRREKLTHEELEVSEKKIRAMYLRLKEHGDECPVCKQWFQEAFAALPEGIEVRGHLESVVLEVLRLVANQYGISEGEMRTVLLRLASNPTLF